MKIDIDDPNVFHLELNVEEARKLLDYSDVNENDEDEEEIKDKVDTALDNAQGAVYSGEHKHAFLVIEIIKE
jgi:hypothetical protein